MFGKLKEAKLFKSLMEILRFTPKVRAKESATPDRVETKNQPSKETDKVSYTSS